MTSSGSSPDRPPENDQERIWDASDQGGAGREPDAPVRSPSPGTGSGAAPTPARASRPAGAPGAWARSLTSTAPLPGPAGFTFADVPNRIIAFTLDVIVLAIIGMFLALLIGGAFGGLASGGTAAGGSLESAGGELNIGAFLVVGIAQLAISFGYFGYSWVVLRGTAGMKVLSLQIGDQVDGHSISWDQGLIRWLLLGLPATLATFAVYVPSVVGLLVGLCGFAWLVVLLYTMAQSLTKQGLHDRLAQTILVRTGRRAV